MVDWLFHRGFLGDDATGAVVAVVTGPTLRLLGAVGDLPPLPLGGVELPLGLDLPLCRAARLGVPVRLTDRTAIESDSPWLTAFAPHAGSVACAPIRDGTGVIGSYGVAYGRAWSDDDFLAARLDQIGLMLGRTARRSGAPPPP